MAYPSVTYTFTNGTTASATEVNQNFTDLINGLSDGTKDLSISALTVAGTASLNGAVNIGNATSDDIAVNGYITTALIPKTDDSVDLGTAALAWQDAYFDGAVYTDTISELTSASGVTIDGVKLKDSNMVPDAGKGIDFSANSGSAGETSSLLDWYEEGTWTPTLSFGGTAATLAVTNASYTRIGNRLLFQAYVTITVKGAGTGAAVFGGLPFTVGAFAPIYVWCNGVSSNGNTIQGFVESGATTIAMKVSPVNADATAGGNATATHFSSTAGIMIGGAYIIS
jgi:hypothetical protein